MEDYSQEINDPEAYDKLLQDRLERRLQGKSFYLGGASFGKGADQTDRFLKEGIWENGKEQEDLDLVKSVKKGDIIFLKSSYATKDSGFLRIKAVGEVIENTNDGHLLKVIWLNKELFDIEGKLSKHRSTFTKLPWEEAKQILESLRLAIGFKEYEEIFRVRQGQIFRAKETIIYSETDSVFLNTDSIAKIFAEVVISSSKVKLSSNSQEDRFYGIFGQWGRGKTKLWTIIKQYISKNYKSEFKTIEFHAWKYQDTPAIWAYMFQKFADEYYWKSKWTFNPIQTMVNWFQSFWLNVYRNPSKIYILLTGIIGGFLSIILSNGFRELALSLKGIPLGALSLGSLAFFLNGAYYTFKKPTVARAKQFINSITRKDFKIHLGLQHEIQEELKNLFLAWNSNKKFILFIDDIDRCDEKKIIQIVDSIRVMLNEPKIQEKLIVLAAIDERILSEAIRSKYTEFVKSPSLDVNRLSAEYLDKLFIAGIKLDELNIGEIEEIILSITDSITDKTTIETTDYPNFETSHPDNRSIGFAGEVDFDNENYDSEDFKKIPKTIEIQNQLHPKEQQILRVAAIKLLNATPRSIRSFSIKYRLARNLLETRLNEYSLAYNQWNDENYLAKTTLAEIIVYKMNFQSDTEDLVNNYSDYLKDSILKSAEMVTYYSNYTN